MSSAIKPTTPWYTNAIETGYQSETTAEGRRYLLPRRQLGTITKWAFIAVVVGAVTSVALFLFSVLPTLLAIKNLVVLHFGAAANNGNAVDEFITFVEIVFNGFASVGFFFVVKFTFFALAIHKQKSRCEVVVGDQAIVHRELFYGFSFKLKQPLEDVDAVYLNPLIPLDAEEFEEGKEAYEFLFRFVPEDIFALGFKQRSPVPIAPGYRLEVLAPIAQEIRRDLERFGLDGRNDIDIIHRTAYRVTPDDRLADS